MSNAREPWLIKMDPSERAKQFMPFAALKGYEEALRAKEQEILKKTENQIEKEHTDYDMTELDDSDYTNDGWYDFGDL